MVTDLLLPFFKMLCLLRDLTENIGESPETRISIPHCICLNLIHNRLPADRYKGLARKTLLQGSFLTRPSPCGLDCSYNLTFAAPSLRCVEATNMPNLNDTAFPIAYTSPFKDLENFDPTKYNYMGAPIKSNNTFLGQSTDDSFVFVVSFRAPDDDSYQFFSCVMMDATYNSQVTYKNGTQNIDLHINNEKPLNASFLDVPSLFYDLMAADSGTAPMTYPTTFLKKTEDQVLTAMHGTQIRSMGDAMLYCLAGYIKEYGMSAFLSLVPEPTPFYSFVFSKIVHGVVRFEEFNFFFLILSYTSHLKLNPDS